MIEHQIHFFQKGHIYTWRLWMPFRFITGDRIHYELLLNRATLLYDKKIDDSWYELFDEYLLVESIDIDHNGEVCAWLSIPPDTE